MLTTCPLHSVEHFGSGNGYKVYDDKIRSLRGQSRILRCTAYVVNVTRMITEIKYRRSN